MFVRLLILSVISVGLVACASTGSETPDSASAGVGDVAADNSATQALEQAAGEELSDVDTSALPQTASVEEDYDPNEIVCKRERQTGSKFTTKTCMTRAELEARKERDQEIMESMSRRQSGGSCALNLDC